MTLNYDIVTACCFCPQCRREREDYVDLVRPPPVHKRFFGKIVSYRYVCDECLVQRAAPEQREVVRARLEAYRRSIHEKVKARGKSESERAGDTFKEKVRRILGDPHKQ